jgi:predicted nucleotidyltransferase
VRRYARREPAVPGRYSRSMPGLERASLSPVERRVVERFAQALAEEQGADLAGVWLYGSRARGEPPRPESDVDLLVVSERASWADWGAVMRLLDEAASAEGVEPARFSVHLYDPERLAQRRAIRSFFIQEVDRDKIVLAGRG